MPRSKNPLFLGIDLGTTGCRACVIDDHEHLVASAHTALPPSTRRDGGCSEQQAADWWHAVVDVVTSLDGSLRARVHAMAVDGTSSTLLLSDTQGHPLTPALMYDDARSGAQAERIARVAPTDCAALGPTSALAKLLWLCEQRGIGGDVRALHQADWVVAQLTGTVGVSDENNCLKLGYDVVARCWPAWLGTLPVAAAQLPRVVPVGTPIGTLGATAADQLAMSTDTVVVSGTTDSNAATLAAGVTQTGDAVTSLGSTLVLKVFSERPVFDAASGVYSHRIGQRWLVGGASNSGGAVLRQYFDDDEIAALSARIDPDSDSGLDYYPLPQVGERFPVNDPHLSPRLSPRPADRQRFLQGLLEGIARIELRGYRRLASLGAPFPRRVFSSGGGAVNDIWQRLRQRQLGVPVTRARQVQAAYGCALLARGARRDTDAGSEP